MGVAMTMRAIYEEHSVNRPFLARNYKTVLNSLFKEVLAIIGKRIFLDFRRPATGHANLVSGVGSAEMDRSSG